MGYKSWKQIPESIPTLTWDWLTTSMDSANSAKDPEKVIKLPEYWENPAYHERFDAGSTVTKREASTSKGKQSDGLSASLRPRMFVTRNHFFALSYGIPPGASRSLTTPTTRTPTLTRKKIMLPQRPTGRTRRLAKWEIMGPNWTRTIHWRNFMLRPPLSTMSGSVAFHSQLNITSSYPAATGIFPKRRR